MKLPRENGCGRNRANRIAILAGVGVWLVAGCQRADDRRAEVNGSVRIDAEPLAEGAISFYPIDGTSGPSSGAIIARGEYRIPRSQGAAVGRNRVEIRAFGKSGRKVRNIWHPEQMVDERVSILAPEYNDRSTLVREIQAGQNQLNFDLSQTRGD